MPADSRVPPPQRGAGALRMCLEPADLGQEGRKGHWCLVAFGTVGGGKAEGTESNRLRLGGGMTWRCPLARVPGAGCRPGLTSGGVLTLLLWGRQSRSQLHTVDV